MLCPRCKDIIPAGKNKCSCGWFVVPVSLGNSGVLLSDVKSADVDRIQTGPWDEMWGTNYKDGKSGIVRTSVSLIGGSPGAGKSTLLLMMADAAAVATGKESAYIATEEPLEQIKARADRLGLENQGKIRMVSTVTGESDLPDPGKCGFIILDSVNGMAGEDMRQAVSVAKMLKRMVEKGKCPAIAISHINKRGDIAGLESLQHEVDTTMTFFPTEENLGVESPRQLVVEKNRNGQAYKKMIFAMTEKGLVAMEEES